MRFSAVHTESVQLSMRRMQKKSLNKIIRADGVSCSERRHLALMKGQVDGLGGWSCGESGP